MVNRLPLSNTEHMASRRLAVMAPPSFAARWLAPRLHDFVARHPEVELRLTSTRGAIDHGPGARGPGVDGDAAALWIRFGAGRPPGGRIDALFAPEHTVLCSPALLRAKLPLRRPADLRYHRLIHDHASAEGGERRGWDEWLALAGVGGIDTRAGAHFDDAGLALAMALDGFGVALLAPPLASAEIAAGRLVVPFGHIVLRRSCAYYAVTPEVGVARGALAAFRGWLMAQARQPCRWPPAVPA